MDDRYEVNDELQEEGGGPEAWTTQVLGRRRFLFLTGAAGAALAFGGNVLAASRATTPAQRAIAGLKALGLPAGTTITVFAEDLTILGSKVTQAKFEQESGIKLNIQSAPFLQYVDKVFADAATKGGNYDLVYVEHNRYGDLDSAGYLTDLTPWVNKYNPGLNDMIAPQSRVWSKYNGKYVGLPTDGDVWILYYRKDLLNNPKEKKAFRAKYGRPLTLPKTWDE